MVLLLCSLFVGEPSLSDRYLAFALIPVGFATAATVYALELFSVSDGLVWVPFHAAILGMALGCWIGYSRNGLVFGWLVTYESLLGYHAYRAVLVSPDRKLIERAGYFLRPDGLVFLAVEGIVLGTLAFVLGVLVRRGQDALRRYAVVSGRNR